MDLNALKAAAKAYWSKDRLKKLTAGKKLLILPDSAGDLLFACGIMNKDASISADNVRKFLQINHMLQLILPMLQDAAQRHALVRIADLGCGNSYLSIMCAWYCKTSLNTKTQIVGIDHNEKVIAASTKRALDLQLDDACRFVTSNLADIIVPELFGAPDVRPHIVLALHACDTATDQALAIAINSSADHFAIAPCCQAELAQKWAGMQVDGTHPHFPMFKSPHMRREMAADYTDLLRILLARGRGYEVNATEFVDSRHTPKNRLLMGHRRGRYLQEAQEQYLALKTALGGQSISLESLIESSQSA